MLRKKILYNLLTLFANGILLFSMAGCGAVTPVSQTHTKLTPTASPTLAKTATRLPATATSTPVAQADADPAAWLDASVNLDQFPAKGALVVHFNTPMNPQNSSNPVLTWPALQGTIRWNESNTSLTYSPAAPLDSKKTYTFFLDPQLQSASSKALKDAPEWVVHVQSAPQVLNIYPGAGDLLSRDPRISVTFDRDMDPTLGDSALTIQPALPFEMNWQNATKLEIVLKAPLENNTRYDLTLSGLRAADGSALDDYRWFYNGRPLSATTENWGSRAIKLKFNQPLDKEKSGFPFAISPALAGGWEWLAPSTAVFTATEPIMSSKDYTLTFTGPLTDRDGFKTSIIPALTFTGISPVILLGIEHSKYSDTAYVEPDNRTFTVQFSLPVDHASAEKAFSLKPAAPGEFTWETSQDAATETLIYTLDELLQPATYTLQIDSSLKDRQGQAILGHPYRQLFTSSMYSHLNSSFGEYGDNVQVVDANGPRKVQIQGADQDINFSAYRFDLIDFAKLYADHYRSRRSNGIRDIPVPAGLTASARWTEISERQMGSDRDKFSIAETTLPAELAPGLYILDMHVKNVLYDQLFLIVSRNTLVVKNDGQNLFVWLTNINGENVPNGEVRVYSATGEKIREGKTDINGQYRVPIPPGAEPMLVSAHVAPAKGQPDDVTISGFGGWYTYIPYNYDDSDYYENSYLPAGQPYMLYAYTERPIYRPGQQVNFKALVRIDHDMRYEVPPANTLVKVSMLDARNNSVETLDLRTNRYGTINGAFALTEGAMLGDYTIETELDGVTSDVSFKVEDYRKPDYQIKITSLQPEKKDRFVRGEQVKLQVNASYYFGEPLANTKLQIDFYGLSLPYGILGQTMTDEHGNATITFEAPYEDSQSSYYYYSSEHQTRLEISADDGSNQVVSSVYGFTVFPAAENLSLSTDSYYASPEKPVKVTASVVDLYGKPVADRELTLSLKQWNRKSFEYETVDQTYKLKTDSEGHATQEITLATGYYDLKLQGKDASGNETHTSHWLGVFKDYSDWFQRSKENQLTISADRDSYKPYQKARFAIESNFSGPALLSFERGSVINTKMIQLTAPLTIVETELIPEHAPNVYVIVNAWQAPSDQDQLGYWGFSSIPDSRLRMASTQIRVDASAKALDISIQPDKKTYAPGEKVTALIQVNDADGKPALAELSLAVVDESIFALADDTSGEIFAAFYGPRSHTVGTYDSMEPSRYIPGGQGGGGGNPPPAAPRSDFLDTSAWLPAVETDANGQATVSFDLPDNTTSWRLTAKAITLNHKVGQAQTNIETKKEVFVRPSLPRVLTSGDQAMLTALVHNYAATTQTVTVNLAAAGLDLQGPNDQQITLKAGEVQTVGWRVTVSGAKPTEVTIAVQGTDSPLDAVRLPLLIQPAAVKDVQNQSGQFSGNLTLALPLPNVQRETSQVRLTLNRSMSGTILNGLEYLTGYPYGCVEQTMSRALPNAVVGHAASQLGIGGPALQAQVDPLIKAGIQKLYSLQHYDGGWGWWADDLTDPYETAWVLFGLGLMDQSGYKIDAQVMDNAAEWLKYNYHSSDMDIRTKAYVLYSMAEAGRGDKDATIQLATDSITQLDPFSQAALALALDKLGEKQQAHSIMALLTQSAMKKDDQVYWPQPSYDGEYHHKTMASTTRTTALVLLAYTRIEPKSTLIPGVVVYLAQQRQGIYGWGTTNETSFTILALTEYFKSQAVEMGSMPYEVFANGKSLAQGTLEANHPIAALDIPMTELQEGLNSLQVSTQGDRALYYDLSTDYDLLQSNPQAAGKIKVQRSYLDPKTKLPLTKIHAGQLVEVKLDVDIPEPASFVAVEDHLPGGLEALNEGLNAIPVGAANPWGGYEDFTHYYWGDYGYNYKEIRGDRVVFFITLFEKGSNTFTYFARATTPGRFTALATQAYAMYDLAMWGRSDNTQIYIK